jgi:hypothetical protein
MAEDNNLLSHCLQNLESDKGTVFSQTKLLFKQSLWSSFHSLAVQCYILVVAVPIEFYDIYFTCKVQMLGRKDNICVIALYQQLQYVLLKRYKSVRTYLFDVRKIFTSSPVIYYFQFLSFSFIDVFYT